ncbi:T9SS type A sorting domain-containing protein [Flavobacterium capsici]|uniref:T9SS type A sorting domain-containing protein n=1 Tax=Flavobacterium capsici TaxID=3075618 RepID=A0AA96EUT4_9FLAO|nr:MULTISPECIES: T9SS type A sorting domain-containing protein [unclassified Flavobacterium]WNM18187.1 T9SS type A sorting domain-containing protein [Flavobacterium sp. PMR2A8]WNM22238.1 T9SS type A sorting domain-containing protein [Flavobacterium sp. PMTSA4]
MKIFYSQFLIVFFIGISNAQINFEHSYTNTSGSSGNLYSFNTSSGLFYYTKQSNNISIYDENHNFTQDIPIIPGCEILFITDKLFNNDDNVEIVVRKSRNVTEQNPYALYTTWDIFILDNQGSTIHTFFDRKYPHVVKNSLGEYKLIVDAIGSCGGCTYSYNYVYDVYGLPGTLSIDQQSSILDNKIIGYPIPTKKLLTLTNVIPDANKKIEIYDISGKKVAETKIIIEDSEAKIDVSSLQSGVYICRYDDKSIKFIKE